MIDRPKQGFGVPVHEWFFDRLGDAARRELDDFCGETDFLDRDEVIASSTSSAGTGGLVPAQLRAVVEGVHGVKQVLIRGGGGAVEDVPAPGVARDRSSCASSTLASGSAPSWRACGCRACRCIAAR